MRWPKGDVLLPPLPPLPPLLLLTGLMQGQRSAAEQLSVA
jgi:hypothetical protein